MTDVFIAFLNKKEERTHRQQQRLLRLHAVHMFHSICDKKETATGSDDGWCPATRSQEEEKADSEQLSKVKKNLNSGRERRRMGDLLSTGRREPEPDKTEKAKFKLTGIRTTSNIQETGASCLPFPLCLSFFLSPL